MIEDYEDLSEVPYDVYLWPDDEYDGEYDEDEDESFDDWLSYLANMFGG